MKKNGILNAPLSKIVAEIGHMDKLVICDCGLPIPKGTEIVDLALSPNIPRFIDALEVILKELAVEEAIIAQEITTKNISVYKQLQKAMKKIPVKKVLHEEFKNLTRNGTRTYFVRTGETTPYSNIILIAGVTF